MINEIINFFVQNIIYIVIAIGVIYLAYTYLYKPGKEDKYKQLNISKEVKKDLKGLFDITGVSVGYGKTLYIGSIMSGFVLKQIFINYYDKKEITAKVNKMLKKYPEAEELLKDKFKKEIPEEPKVFYGFKVCGKSFFRRLLANLLDIGVITYLVDKELVTETELSYNINPYSQPTKFLDIYIYSSIGKKAVEEIVFKIEREQVLGALVNFTPKLTFLELEQAKSKAQLEILEEINKKKRKEMIEEIKKA